MDNVVYRVHRVGVGHTVEGGTAIGGTGAAVHRGGVRSIPGLVEGVVVPQGKVVLVIDVPVEAGENLHIALVCREIGPGTGFVAVFVLKEFGNLLEILEGGAGDVCVSIAYAVCGTSPPVCDGRDLGVLEVCEEEEFVLHDRSAEGEAVGGVAVLVAGTGDSLALYGVTAHILVAVVDVGAALEGVSTGLGDGVHATSDEVGLTYVIRRNHNLELLDGVDGDRAASARKVGGKTEVVVEVSAVHGEVCGTSVSSGEAHSVSAVR